MDSQKTTYCISISTDARHGCAACTESYEIADYGLDGANMPVQLVGGTSVLTWVNVSLYLKLSLCKSCLVRIESERRLILRGV